jgi:hypothetical protein
MHFENTAMLKNIAARLREKDQRFTTESTEWRKMLVKHDGTVVAYIAETRARINSYQSTHGGWRVHRPDYTRPGGYQVTSAPSEYRYWGGRNFKTDESVISAVVGAVAHKVTEREQTLYMLRAQYTTKERELRAARTALRAIITQCNDGELLQLAGDVQNIYAATPRAKAIHDASREFVHAMHIHERAALAIRDFINDDDGLAAELDKARQRELSQ